MATRQRQASENVLLLPGAGTRRRQASGARSTGPCRAHPYWRHHRGWGPYEGPPDDPVADLLAAFSMWAVRELLRNDNLDARRALVHHIAAVRADDPELAQAAIAVVKAHPDRYLRKRLAYDLGESMLGELDLTRATAQSAQAEAAARQDIRALGLQHHLVTAYTSLVAVDSAPPRRSGAPLSVVQPVDAPQGAYAASYGIPLGGSAHPATIGHESKYVVDGANSTSPAFGTVSATIVQEFIGPPDTLLQRGPEVEPHAHARLRRVTAGTAATEALRALVPAQLPAVGACFIVGPRASYRLHQALTLVVRLGEDGDFPVFGIRSEHPLDPDLATCIRRRLESTLRTALQPGATAQFELRVHMQF